MLFINKPANGPDAVGGIWPAALDLPFRNRSGGAHNKGDVGMLAMFSGIATEIATNDSNSYKPGYSNDTVWNTVVEPTANGIARGNYAVVCMDDVISDNKIGTYRVFGLIEDAFVVTSSSGVTAGKPLTVTTTNSFDPTILSSECVFAHFEDITTTNTTRDKARVFLHNGLIPHPLGVTSGVS